MFFGGIFQKWSGYLVLLFMSLAGTFLCISSKNLFVVWLGFELNMFSVLPLLVNDQSKLYFFSKSELSVSFYYFLVQVMGSVFFSWGSVLGNGNMVGLLGLFIKFGFFPFFWWVPSVFSRLKWFWMFVLSTLQKIPSFFLIRFTFDLNTKFIYLVCLFTLLMSVFGMYSSYLNLKLMIGWSSIGKGSLMLLLSLKSNYYGLIFFLIYSLVLFFCCWCFSQVEMSNMSNFDSLNLNSFSFLVKGVFSMLYFSGLPPFIFFWVKLYSFCMLCFSGVPYDYMKILTYSKLKYFLGELTFSGMDWCFPVLLISVMLVQVVVYLSVFFCFFVQLYGRLYSVFLVDYSFKLVFVFLIKILFVFVFPLFIWLLF